MTSVRRTPPGWSKPHPVYEAEKAALPFGQTFIHLDHAVEYTSAILSTDWWQETYPEIQFVWICESAGKRYAWAWEDEIHLPEFAMNESYLLHELAHIAAPEDFAELHHGPEFRRVFCHILQNTMGEWVAENLRAWYDRFGVPCA